MKKLTNLFLIIVLLLSVSNVVMAANDAVDLSYRLKISVLNDSGKAADTFQIGDTIRVKFSLEYTGTGKAPVYGLQGRFKFDPYVIQCRLVQERNGISAQEMYGQITFVFLDMTGQGCDDTMLADLGGIEFVAKNNGTVQLFGDDFILTNSDASERYIDMSEMVTLIVGTGEKDVTKELLQSDITVAENMLASCTITDHPDPGIYYPDFWITTKTEQSLKDAIVLAKDILNKTDATAEEIEAAVTDLASAVKAFENAKIIGPKRWSYSEDSTELTRFVTVSAFVKAGSGKIHPDFVTQRCRNNTSCTIRVIPDEGYETEYIYVNGERFAGNDIFTIPNVERDSTISVTFCMIPPFTDVAREDWFYTGVRYTWNSHYHSGDSCPLAP